MKLDFLVKRKQKFSLEMLELRDAAKNIVDAAYLLEEATDSIRRAGSVIRGPTSCIQTIAKSLHQASSSLEVASSSLEVMLNEFNRNNYKVDTSEDDVDDLDSTINIKEEELSDEEESFTITQSADFDPLASSQNSKMSNEIEVGGFPDTVSITDLKDIKPQKQTSKELVCSICQYKTYSRKSLTLHINKCSKPGDKLCCSECDYTTNNKTYLKHHMNKHQEGKYKCTYCNYSTGYKPQLKIHVSSKHSREMIKCDECDYKAAHHKYLVQHQKRMHKPNPFKCDECKFTCVYPSDLKIHVSSVHQGVRFQCAQCNQNYPFKGDLVTHIKTVHDKVRYPCQICGFTTPYKFNLKNHLMKIHLLSPELSKNTADKIKANGAIIAKDVINKKKKKAKGVLANKRKSKKVDREIVSNPDDDLIPTNNDDISCSNEISNNVDESSSMEMNIANIRTENSYARHAKIAGFANSTSENIASIANIDNMSTLSDESGLIVSNNICIDSVINNINDTQSFEIVNIGSGHIDMNNCIINDNDITNIIVSNDDGNIVACDEVSTAYIFAAGSSDEWGNTNLVKNSPTNSLNI